MAGRFGRALRTGEIGLAVSQISSKVETPPYIKIDRKGSRLWRLVETAEPMAPNKSFVLGPIPTA